MREVGVYVGVGHLHGRVSSFIEFKDLVVATEFKGLVVATEFKDPVWFEYLHAC